jgi:NADH-quinone oxidoreductase subunit M
MIPFIGIMLVVLFAGVIATAAVEERRSRNVAAVFSGIALILAFAVLAYSMATGGINISESYAYYLYQFSVDLKLQLSVVSLALLLMASAVSFITLISGNVEREMEKASSFLIMLFEFSAIGLFASGNLILFFIFWDIGIIALFFMIYLLGSVNRRRAAIKFLIYELLASLLLLLAIMLIYFYTPLHSFDIDFIMANSSLIPLSIQLPVFLLFFIAFLINMPVFPVHLWLPDAHTEASTQGSMLLSGVLTKFGGYGMILLFMMIPSGYYYSNMIAVLAGFSAFYAAFVMMTQHDIKRVIAYTTIIEMSIILIGISALNTFGTAGATYAMLSHGFVISLLFLAAGSIGYIFGERDMRVLKGVIKGSLSTGYSFLVGVLAVTGVPLTAAFIGDLLIFIGAVQAFSIIGAVPLLVLILVGAYLYYVISKSILSTKEATPNVDYIGWSQQFGYAALLFFIFLFGLLPFIILNFFNL